MTLHAFQQALSELVLSPELRAEVVDRGTAALASFDLDEREQRRVLSIAKQSGLDAGVLIHRSFRLSMIVRSLPGTCRLLGPRLSDLVHDYWREHLPLHYHFVWESCRFARHLRDLVEAGTLAEPWLLDMLRIDLACMALQRGLKPEEVDLDSRPGGDDLAEAAADDRLVVLCHHDPRPLLATPEPDADGIPVPPAGDYRLEIRRRPDGQLAFESL